MNIWDSSSSWSCNVWVLSSKLSLNKLLFISAFSFCTALFSNSWLFAIKSIFRNSGRKLSLIESASESIYFQNKISLSKFSSTRILAIVSSSFSGIWDYIFWITVREMGSGLWFKKNDGFGWKK